MVKLFQKAKPETEQQQENIRCPYCKTGFMELRKDGEGWTCNLCGNDYGVEK